MSWLESAELEKNPKMNTTKPNDIYIAIEELWSLNVSLWVTLREKWPDTELFLVRIFLYSVQIQENTDQK